MQQVIPPHLLRFFPLGLAFMVFVIYTMYVYMVYHLQSKQNAFDQTFVALGTISVLILYWSLYKTWICDPGYVPKNENFIVEDEEEKDETVRMCKFCNIRKPERSHHCSRCKRCILNMDHHCVWTANCIGINNRKSFNLILIWGSIGMLMGTLLGMYNMEDVYQSIWIYKDQKSYFFMFRSIATLLIICSQSLNGIGLLYFSIKNLILVFFNMTTLEELKYSNGQIQPEGNFKNPYDISPYYNFTFYFGDNPLLWFFPVGSPLGNGYNWDKVSELNST